MKSFRPKGDDQGPDDGNGWSDFKGEERSNDTHASTTDPESKLLRKGKGKEARLCFAGHATMENRNGLCVLFDVKPAVGDPESAVAVDQMVDRTAHHRAGLTHRWSGPRGQEHELRAAIITSDSGPVDSWRPILRKRWLHAASTQNEPSELLPDFRRNRFLVVSGLCWASSAI